MAQLKSPIEIIYLHDQQRIEIYQYLVGIMRTYTPHN